MLSCGLFTPDSRVLSLAGKMEPTPTIPVIERYNSTNWKMIGRLHGMAIGRWDLPQQLIFSHDSQKLTLVIFGHPDSIQTWDCSNLHFENCQVVAEKIEVPRGYRLPGWPIHDTASSRPRH